MKQDDLIYRLIDEAFKEDIGSADITTLATLQNDQPGRALIIAKQPGVLAGINVARQVFKQRDAELEINLFHTDGEFLKCNDIVLEVSGSISSILTAERIALNFLGHLSGIATLTANFVDNVKDTSARITDTRKTIPLLRQLEKKAVIAGGGVNHRMGLHDMVLIKENHITAAGGIKNAVIRCREYLSSHQKTLKIEVETRNLDEAREALNAGVDRIMLDNMDKDSMCQAVEFIKGKAEVEASGGISLKTVREIAKTGVDFISVGAITHSAPAFDFSLLIKE